jgi:hypothetical protein
MLKKGKCKYDYKTICFAPFEVAHCPYRKENNIHACHEQFFSKKKIFHSPHKKEIVTKSCIRDANCS